MKILLLLFLVNSWSPFQSGAGELKLIINDIETNSGVVQVLIFNQADGFPEQSKKAYKALSIPVINSSAQTTIKGLPPGDYAVSVFHDEDADGVFKKK